MKAFEQYFHVVVFIVLYKVVLPLKSVDETLVKCVTNQIKVIEQYFHVFLLYCIRWFELLGLWMKP